MVEFERNETGFNDVKIEPMKMLLIKIAMQQPIYDPLEVNEIFWKQKKSRCAINVIKWCISK